jgi:hypothetical protein
VNPRDGVVEPLVFGGHDAAAVDAFAGVGPQGLIGWPGVLAADFGVRSMIRAAASVAVLPPALVCYRA